MGSLLIFKMSKGFTLIELVVVLALIGIIGVLAQFFAIPALGQVVCLREVTMLRQEVREVRFKAQYMHAGDVPVSEGNEIVFVSGRGNISATSAELTLEQDTSCSQIIKISNVGEIS